MTRLILMATLLMCSMSVIAETSVCNGIWENQQPVHVMVDWDKGNVNVNGVVTKIIKATSNGIYTSPHMNRFGHESSFVIINSTYNHYDQNGMFLYSSANRATFVIQMDIDTKTANASYALHCSKSFTKPLMARIL